jgi:hypothetical protein
MKTKQEIMFTPEEWKAMYVVTKDGQRALSVSKYLAACAAKEWAEGEFRLEQEKAK